MTTPVGTGDGGGDARAVDTVVRLQHAIEIGRPLPIPGTIEPRPAMVASTPSARVEALPPNEVPFLPDRSPEAVVTRSLVASTIDKLISFLRSGPSL